MNTNGTLPDGVMALHRFEGVSDQVKPVADRLMALHTPGELGDAVGTGVWDICLIGAEPQRAEKIEFTAAYAEIEATYLVPAGSPIETIAEVDKPGVRIAVSRRSAYGLRLERNVEHATLVTSDSGEDVFNQFVAEKLDAFAGLRPGLNEALPKLPGARVLDGRFATVQQAVGTAKTNVAGAAFLRSFVEEAKASGFVSSLIARHKVEGRLSSASSE